MGIMGTRMMKELNGISCIPIEAVPSHKKEITVSRSFSKMADTYDDLKKAVTAFTTIGAEKLRKQNSICGVMMVYIMTNRFRKGPQYNNMGVMKLPAQTNDTAELIKYGGQILWKIFKKGYYYKKAGIIFKEVVPETQFQSMLFDTKDRKKAAKLMKTLDLVNDNFGRGTLKFAAEGSEEKPGFMPGANRLSPSYTTKWSDIPRVK